MRGLQLSRVNLKIQMLGSVAAGKTIPGYLFPNRLVQYDVVTYYNKCLFNRNEFLLNLSIFDCH